MTLQELQQKGQVKALTINDLKNKGDIKVVQSTQEKPSLIQNIKSDIIKRAENLVTIADISGKGRQQSLASGALQTAGQAAGALGDIGFEIAKKLLPSFIKEPIKAGIKTVAETQPAQKAISSITSWSEQHPEAAKNLVATLNLVTADLPIARLAAGGTKLISKGVSKIAGTLEKSSVKATEKETGAFLRKLITPEQTKLVKEAQVARTIEKGKGIFKRSEILPTKEQLSIESVLKETPVSQKNTYQQNYNIIKNINTNLAKELEKKVAETKFIIPKKETIAKLNNAVVKLSESPLITGDAEIMANRLIEGAKKFISQNPGTGSGLLKARKEFDSWVLSQKPKAFDAKAENAFTIANREVRNTINNLLESKAPNVGVKQALTTQHNLYKALDIIAPKAATEADSAIGRSLQKIGEVLGIKNKAVQATAAVAGIGGLGAAATFAPIVAGVGIPSYLVYKAGKFVINPKTRKTIANVLSKSEKALKTMTNPVKIKALEEANTKLKSYFKNIKPGLTIQDVSKTPLKQVEKTPLKSNLDPTNFKTAEDYVKAQGTPVYRGGQDLSSSNVTNSGISVSNGKQVATDFAKQKGGSVSENIISKNAKIIDYKDIPSVKFKNINDYSPELDTGNKQIWKDLEIEYQKAINYAKQNGYDGVKLPLEGETRIINADVIKTKSQLTDIWNKANK
jgi:hypothetical protein